MDDDFWVEVIEVDGFSVVCDEETGDFLFTCECPEEAAMYERILNMDLGEDEEEEEDG